jgi:ubiquinone/menaquinone biosynthesis C-methylase UbiE
MPPEATGSTTINYAAAAPTYDNTRRHSDALIDRFCRIARLDADAEVLEFGCGTGNYLYRIHERHGSRCHGVDPSAAMRTRAAAKSPALDIVDGSHAGIPFAEATFDFCYMVDVIHHVPDLPSMFGELLRVLKLGGALAVVTESHAQIEARFYNRYFPSLAAVEKRRYPDLGVIIARAVEAGFRSPRVESFPRLEPSEVSARFVTNVAERNYSMFRLIPEEEYAAGLNALRADLGRRFDAGAAGGTMLCFSRPGALPLDPAKGREAL